MHLALIAPLHRIDIGYQTIFTDIELTDRKRDGYVYTDLCTLNDGPQEKQTISLHVLSPFFLYIPCTGRLQKIRNIVVDYTLLYAI